MELTSSPFEHSQNNRASTIALRTDQLLPARALAPERPRPAILQQRAVPVNTDGFGGNRAQQHTVRVSFSQGKTQSFQANGTAAEEISPPRPALHQDRTCVNEE